MWTEAHRARHEARLKSRVTMEAVGQVAAWLERADPPRSGRATPSVAVVGAIAWHLRVGGAWRALPPQSAGATSAWNRRRWGPVSRRAAERIRASRRAMASSM